MEQLVLDRTHPRHWPGSNRASYHTVEKKASRVKKSYATPCRIKGRHTRGFSASFWKEERAGAEESDIIPDPDMFSQSPPSKPRRPNTSVRADSDTSASSTSSSSVSTLSSGTRRPSSTNTGTPLSFDLSPAPRHPPPPSSSDRVSQGPGTPASPHSDQTALVSPMRTLWLTMPPIGDSDSDSRAAKRSKKPPSEFYTWENLPPLSLVRKCLDGFYSGRGMPELMCPVARSEAIEIMENIYSNSTTAKANNHTYPRPAPRTADANYLLCFMLLLAALGARYLADNEVTDDEQAALFTSGRWYLDMAFGIKDANDLQRLRANVLVALNLIFEKKIVSIEYLNRAIAIGLARGLHRSTPPAASRTPPRTATVGAEPDGYAGSRNRQQTVGDSDTQLLDYWPYWKRIWQSLVFVDGWLSTSVGGVPQVCKTLEPISEDLGHLGNPQQQHHLVVHQHGQHSLHHPSNPTHHSQGSPHHPPHHSPYPEEGGDGGCGGCGGANRPSSRDLEGNVHAELARLGVLMGAITKDVIAPETVELNMVRVYNDRLQAWHSTLPEALTLQSAVRNQYELPHKNSTLLIHCAYLLSITHLTRRVLVETATAQLSGSSSLAGVRSGSVGSGSSSNSASSAGAGEGLLAEPTATAEVFSTMCVDVAHQIATVVGMLRAEDKLTRRCWLIIQSAYTAAMIICLDLARNRGRPQLESKFNDSQLCISACIDTLHQSAGSDPVAQRYLQMILPIYRTLTIPDTSLVTKRARLYRDPLSGAFGDPGSEAYPTNAAVLDTILEYLKAPYGGERTIMDQDFFSAGGAGNFPEHYRFLNPPPSNTRFNIPRQPNGHSQIYPISNGNLTPSNGTHDIRMGNHPMDNHQSSPPKNRFGAFKSMEELEAFYRRVT